MLECNMESSAFVEIVFLPKNSWQGSNLSAIWHVQGTQVPFVVDPWGRIYTEQLQVTEQVSVQIQERILSQGVAMGLPGDLGVHLKR